MPLDIRSFFSKGESKNNAGGGAAGGQGAAPARRNQVRPETKPTATINKNSSPAGSGRSKKTADRSPEPSKRSTKKRLVIEDSSSDDDSTQSDEVQLVKAPAIVSSTSSALSTKKRKSEENDVLQQHKQQRREISSDDFFSDSGKPKERSSATASPTKKVKSERPRESASPSKAKAPPPPSSSLKKTKTEVHKDHLLQPSRSSTKAITSDQLRPGCLNGLTFVFSGVLENLSREDSQELVKELGGRVTTAVSGKTDYLVVGPELEDGRPFTEGSKYKKALETKTIVVQGTEHFYGLLVQYDDKARAAAGESLRRDDESDGDVKDPTESSRMVSTSAMRSSSVKPPPMTTASLKAPPIPESRAAASMDSVAKMPPKPQNPYAKAKANPYAKKPVQASERQETSMPATKLVGKKINDGSAAATNSTLWVDKYKPQSTKDILGNQDCVRKLQVWLAQWEARFNTPQAIGKSFAAPQGPWKAALLSGPPGIGKTTTATLVAKEAGRDLIEFNASDVRSKTALQEHLGDITGSRTIEFTAKKQRRTKRCIVMDEVDGMGGGDRGGIASLIQLIKHSQVPIICICNDRQSQKIKSLLPYCMDLRYRRPVKSVLAKRAVDIAAREGMIVEPNAAEAMAESCGNDVRQVINALQMWKSEDNVSKMTYKQLKDRQYSINKDEVLRVSLFDAARTILEGRRGLSNSDPQAEREHFFKRDDAFFVDYSFVGLIVQQNYLKVLQGDYANAKKSNSEADEVNVLERMYSAAESMSDYDLVSTSVSQAQNWNLLPFSSICTVKTGFHAGGPRGGFLPGFPEFTAYLGKLSTRSKKMRLLHELQHHTNYHITGSTQEMRTSYVPIFRERFLSLLQSDEGGGGVDAAIDLMDEYGLDRDDVFEKLDEFLLDSKAETFANVNSKKKAAFTRAYNARVHTSQALVDEQFSGARKVKRAASSISEAKDLDVIDEDVPYEEEDEAGDDDDEADHEKLKSLFKPSRKGKSATGKAKTEGKGREKAKK